MPLLLSWISSLTRVEVLARPGAIHASTHFSVPVFLNIYCKSGAALNVGITELGETVKSI